MNIGRTSASSGKDHLASDGDTLLANSLKEKPVFPPLRIKRPNQDNGTQLTWRRSVMAPRFRSSASEPVDLCANACQIRVRSRRHTSRRPQLFPGPWPTVSRGDRRSEGFPQEIEPPRCELAVDLTFRLTLTRHGSPPDNRKGPERGLPE